MRRGAQHILNAPVGPRAQCEVALAAMTPVRDEWPPFAACARPDAEYGAKGHHCPVRGAAFGRRSEISMPSLHTQEQIWARDDQGMKHAVTVTRAPIPGSPYLQGLPHFAWGAGRSLNLVDDKAGILECVRTKQRLTIEDWGS